MQFERGSGTEVALNDRFSTCTHSHNEGDIGADVAVWKVGPHDNHAKQHSGRNEWHIFVSSSHACTSNTFFILYYHANY